MWPRAESLHGNVLVIEAEKEKSVQCGKEHAREGLLIPIPLLVLL